MQDFDRGFKSATHVSHRQMARMAGLSCTRWRTVASEMQFSERFADRAYTAQQHGERFVVYFEAYTTWDDRARWNMLAKSGVLSERERLPTKCIVFILLPEGYRPQGGEFRLTVGGQTTQLLSFEEVRLWEQEPQPWWQEAPGLMTLYPLTRHPEGPEEAVRHAATVIERQVEDVVRCAELLTVLGVFGTLAHPDIHPFEIIGSHRMRESTFYQEIKAEGSKETLRANTRRVLEIRFGAPAVAPLANRVNSVDDLELLNRLHDLAVACQGIDEFRAALPPPPQPARRRRSSRPSRR